uniref:Uncharacterized protein n=1 Tax=Vespula pensylvanica TaxID=30213 RepID=A0A834NGS4_VESPE|nr:hypothetical protein H0235_014534 [Vespula pensylvanica]
MATEGVVPCRTSSTTSRQIDLESLQNPTLHEVHEGAREDPSLPRPFSFNKVGQGHTSTCRRTDFSTPFRHLSSYFLVHEILINAAQTFFERSNDRRIPRNGIKPLIGVH